MERQSKAGSNTMRLAVTGGGTAGHVYPALAVVSAWLATMAGGVELKRAVLYLGSAGGMEEALVSNSGVPFASIQAGPLREKNALVVTKSCGMTAWGLGQAWWLLGRFRPHVLLATGGYVSVPVALAARLRAIPLVLYLPDIQPGWAIRFLAPFAQRIAVTAAASQPLLPQGKVVETGYPVREELSGLDKAEARRRLGLGSDLTTLLVLGGSRGAHSLNQAVGRYLEGLLRICQVLHICGREDEEWLKERASALNHGLGGRYYLHQYLHLDFPWALAAADLVLSRAGASVLGEFPAAALPSILVPYPYAGSHQEANARFLAEAGAAAVLRNGELDGLFPLVQTLVKDPDRLARMAEGARALRRAQAAQSIAALLAEVGRTCRR